MLFFFGSFLLFGIDQNIVVNCIKKMNSNMNSFRVISCYFYIFLGSKLSTHCIIKLIIKIPCGLTSNNYHSSTFMSIILQLDLASFCELH